MGAKERVLVITTLYFIYFILCLLAVPLLFSLSRENMQLVPCWTGTAESKNLRQSNDIFPLLEP